MTPVPVSLRRLDLAALQSDPAVAAARAALVHRGAVPDASIRDRARAIVGDVRRRGDAAVVEANERFGGGAAGGRLVIRRVELAAARDRLPSALRTALERIVENIARFHEAQLPRTERIAVEPGIEIERRWVPLARVGIYVPGGSAAYPSSLLMAGVPARVAGVGSIVVASPTDPAGGLSPVLLGAAGMMDVDELIVAGGAQAIAALAYGLPAAGVRRADRIVGPGNAWVTAAKLEVFGDVGIDLPAGPSEVMVLADSTADPRHVAADLLSQAEHGPDSPALLVTTDPGIAAAVEAELGAQLAGAARLSTLERSLAAAALVVMAPDLDTAIVFVNDYAPEHLSVVVDHVEEAVARISNAGSLFVGRFAPESAGDYASGANHVLPTGGLARSSGALDVSSFGKFIQVQRISRDGLASIRSTVGLVAEAEGLLAHRAAVEVRFEAESATPTAVADSIEQAARR